MSAERLRVVMRADASPQIGLGHVKRCLSLAEALSAAGCDVLLLSRDLGVDVHALAASHRIDVEMLPRPRGREPIESDVAHAHWAGVAWSGDAQDSIDAIAGRRIDWLVVDHYSFDTRWHEKVGGATGADIAVIDDLADRRLGARVVVDHNFVRDHRAKYRNVVPAHAKILGGPRFALLSSAYVNAMPYSFRETVESIGVFMGGFDAPDWSSVVVHACREQAGFAGTIEIATTGGNPNLGTLRALEKRWPRTLVRTDMPQLADFFARHDLQIGAGGGAMWERCRAGAPTLALVCADNQREGLAGLRDIGVVATVDPLEEPSADDIGRALRQLIDAPETRRRMAEASRSLVDGLGACRVALSLAARRIVLRDARREDAALMHEWRNHPSTRVHSIQQGEIAWATHVAWLDRVLGDADRLLQVGTIGSIPVGVIRFDGITGAQAEVSLYLDPRLHGLGLGRHLLEAGEKHASQRGCGVRRVLASVQATNIASRRMFEASGYVPHGEGLLVKDLFPQRQD